MQLEAARAQHAARKAALREAGVDAAEEMDALASPRVQSHKDDVGGAAQPRASIFQGFSIPGLRGKALAKVTAPAKQTRPDKNSIMVKRQSEAATSSGAGDSPVLRGSGAQPVIPEQDEESPLTLTP